jgi:hypothetical protein
MLMFSAADGVHAVAYDAVVITVQSADAPSQVQNLRILSIR